MSKVGTVPCAECVCVDAYIYMSPPATHSVFVDLLGATTRSAKHVMLYRTFLLAKYSTPMAAFPRAPVRACAWVKDEVLLVPQVL